MTCTCKYDKCPEHPGFDYCANDVNQYGSLELDREYQPRGEPTRMCTGCLADVRTWLETPAEHSSHTRRAES